MRSLLRIKVIIGCCVSVLCLAASLSAQNDTEYRSIPLSQTQLDQCLLEETHCGKARALITRYLSGQLVNESRSAETRRMIAEASEDTDLLHNNLDIEIFPASEVITGSNTMTVESLVNGLTEFTFRLRSNYTITSALINGTTPVSVTSVGTYGRLVTLDRPYDIGETFTLSISYTGTAVAAGFGSIVFSQQYGIGDDIVYTLSEPYFAATWWPTKDGDWGEPGDNSDKATLELAVTAPSSMRTVSNGLLQSIESLSGGRSKYHWSSNYPTATYLVCFSSTTYNTWTQMYNYATGSMPVEFNIYPASDTGANRTAWEKCLDMLDAYGQLFGLYPFINEKYGIYQCEFGGGMEHQTNTAQGGFGEWLTAHELTHQWWGDAITCKTWHDIWLNEGFATYGEALWEENKPGSSGLPALFSAMASRRPGSVGDSVYVYDTTDLYRIFSGTYSYRKGAWVLHQLRHVVGDQTFYNILSAYRVAYEGSGATTDDFAAVCSAVYGQDLSWFFNEWVYGIGAPAYRWGYQTFGVNGQQYLRLHIEQVQNPSYGVFSMPIDIRVNTLGGPSTYTVWNDEDLEHFVVPISLSALSAFFDEFDWILHTSDDQVSYVNGPPAVIQTDPLPGTSLVLADLTQIGITFSEDVISDAGDYAVVGDTVGQVPFTLSYSSGNYTATLNFDAPLPVDVYTVNIDDTIVSAIALISLDGEVEDPSDPASLPSGEGLPGGTAAYSFTIESTDCNGNGIADDIDIAQGTSEDCQPNGIPDECEGGPWIYGDVNGNLDVNLIDLLCMLDGLASVFNCPGVTFEDLDIDPCSGNGDLNLMDLFALLDTLGGLPPCPDPCL